jgi:hypothetical protein
MGPGEVIHRRRVQRVHEVGRFVAADSAVRTVTSARISPIRIRSASTEPSLSSACRIVEVERRARIGANDRRLGRPR